MKYPLLKLLVLCFGLFSASVFADIAPQSIIKNYQTLDQKDLPQNFIVAKGTIRVLDFFSYGCPHCAKLAPYLAGWEKSNAALLLSPNANKKLKPYIIFQPVPVSFESGWNIYSKAFHIAEYLHKNDLLNDDLFTVSQNPLLGLNSDEQMKSFFLHHAVSLSDYEKAADPTLLQQKLDADAALLKTFKITEIPTVIVADGTHIYRISNRTVAHADPQTFIETLTFLTQKKPKI